ncbi:uncharacterized protein LOC142636492 isoform X4 [Castanea sativa]|uniref:uncharacterized protein LOC142636492 isoform X4 n=1 Tax=Castanea sativa TaxID=21020 RepID=UPI003F64DB8B
MAGMAKALTLSFSSSSSRNLILWPHHHLPIPNWSWRRKRTPTMAMAKVVPAVIVGSGRVGRALQEMGNGQDLVVKRGQSVPLDFVGPILVCTRNDDLDAVLQATPPSRWNDLVFFQNGMLEPWLNSKGLSDAEQVLAYFAVSKLGETPVDGKTDTNPEGLTAAYGKWAPAVAARLHAAALSCKVSSLIVELASAAAAEKGLVFDEAMEDRLCAYSRAVAHFPTAIKEFKWRNGWFYSLSEKAIAQGKPDPCCLHTAWLQELKIV